MDDYVYIYTSIAFRSAVRQISISCIQKVYVAPILASKKTSTNYMACENIMPGYELSLGTSLARVGRNFFMCGGKLSNFIFYNLFYLFLCLLIFLYYLLITMVDIIRCIKSDR